MNYFSLDTIPYKTFLRVAATGDFSLLSDTEKDLTVLELIWEKLFKEHLDYENTPESKRELRITIDIDCLEIEYKFIFGACDCLAFAYDQELVDILRSKRYELRTNSTENYYEDIEKIKRFSKGLKTKIKLLSQQLKKSEAEEENDKKNNAHEKLTIDDVMASYTNIMGFDFDYNSITYTKFNAIKRQVNLKIKAISENNKTKK